MKQKEAWKVAGDGLTTMYWANVAAIVGIVIMVPVTVLAAFGFDLKGAEALCAAFGMILGFGSTAMGFLALLSLRPAHRLYALAWKLLLVVLGMAVLAGVAAYQNHTGLSIFLQSAGVLISMAQMLLLIGGTNRLLEDLDELVPDLLRLSKWVTVLMIAKSVLDALPTELFGGYNSVLAGCLDVFRMIAILFYMIYLRDAGRRLSLAAEE